MNSSGLPNLSSKSLVGAAADHLFRPHPLLDQLREPILERRKHLVLGIQIGMCNCGSHFHDSDDDTQRVGIGYA